MTAPVILVAHDSEGIRHVIVSLLEAAGFSVRAVIDGHACMDALAEATPDGLVLDVALSGVLAFTVIEEARRRAPSLRIILVASIYNRTSYKRKPTSLYGADDYVEQHHIPDALVGKLEGILGGAKRAVTELAPHTDTPEGRAVRSASESRLEGADAPSAEAVLRAQRLARLIVADIALYNGDLIGAARPDQDIERVEAGLRSDLEEGRVLFDLRIPTAVRRGRDFIGEALAELLARPHSDKENG